MYCFVNKDSANTHQFKSKGCFVKQIMRQLINFGYENVQFSLINVWFPFFLIAFELTLVQAPFYASFGCLRDERWPPLFIAEDANFAITENFGQFGDRIILIVVGIQFSANRNIQLIFPTTSIIK